MIFPEKYFEKEIRYNASRSGGKGGQHVNKVETKVELNFNVPNSSLLDEMQKQTILLKLKNQINSEGTLRVVSQSERSQLLNKKRAEAKFLDLINRALKKKKLRKKTGVTKASKEKRLKSKQVVSEKKNLRRIDMGKEIY